MFVMALGVFINVVAMAGIQGTSTAPSTYMGVDANDKEAVKKRIDELNHEKWIELFGDEAKVEDFDFTGFDYSATRKLREVFSKLFSGVFGNKQRPEATSISPQH